MHILEVTPELARYRKYKLGRFSTEVSNDSADGKIAFKVGGFSIILVLNFVNCTSGRPRPSYEEDPEKTRRNQESERRQGRKYLWEFIQEKDRRENSEKSSKKNRVE